MGNCAQSNAALVGTYTQSVGANIPRGVGNIPRGVGNIPRGVRCDSEPPAYDDSPPPPYKVTKQKDSPTAEVRPSAFNPGVLLDVNWIGYQSGEMKAQEIFEQIKGIMRDCRTEEDLQQCREILQTGLEQIRMARRTAVEKFPYWKHYFEGTDVIDYVKQPFPALDLKPYEALLA